MKHFPKILIIVFIVAFFANSVFMMALIFILFNLYALGFQYCHNKDIKKIYFTQEKYYPHLDDEPTRVARRLFPINIDNHAYSLKQFLTEPSVMLLKELVEIVNELHNHLDYLEAEHPYLATAVNELITDVALNTILRIDKSVETFIDNINASKYGKTKFQKEQEPRIIELFKLHLTELSELNESILEKQMSTFSAIDTIDEMNFRNRVMELKILLRWYIAQQPNEFSATSHQVILDRLQKTTLAKMTESFYHADITDGQRKELQNQIDELLEHFKTHSPMIRIHHEAEILQLNNQQNTFIEQVIANNRQQAQMEIQDFIDFNKQYVKQLKQHW